MIWLTWKTELAIRLLCCSPQVRLEPLKWSGGTRNRGEGIVEGLVTGPWSSVLVPFSLRSRPRPPTCFPGPLQNSYPLSRSRPRPPTHFPYPLPVPIPQKVEETKEADMTPGKYSDSLSKAGSFGDWGGTECLRHPHKTPQRADGQTVH